MATLNMNGENDESVIPSTGLDWEEKSPAEDHAEWKDEPVVVTQCPLPALSSETLALRSAVDEFFEADVWKKTSSGYILEKNDGNNEQEEMLKKGSNDPPQPYILPVATTSLRTQAGEIFDYNALTYGEVTTIGARQLFSHMGLTGPPNGSKEEVVFVDLGSGCGRLVMQAYMELPRLTKSLGIELSEVRHQSAVDAWEQLQSQAQEIRSSHGDASAAEVELIQGDLLQADLSAVTHIFISSLCFPDSFVSQIAKKLENHTPPNLQCVATLKQFPMKFEKRGIVDRISYELIYKTFGLVRKSKCSQVEMSWTQHRPGGCRVHVYSKPTK